MKTTSNVAKDHIATAIKDLEAALTGGNAHASFDDAVRDLPHDLLGAVPAGLPYSIWQLVEHIRITQWDILEFSRNPHHTSPHWPDDYWPKRRGKAEEWDRSVEGFFHSLRKVEDLVLDEKRDLLAPFPWGEGHTLLREALLAIQERRAPDPFGWTREVMTLTV